MIDLYQYTNNMRDNAQEHGVYERYFKKIPDDWNKYCVSMDIIEDTEEAIKAFGEEGFGGSDGERYLRLYGVLQAVFLQQDAIKSLYRILKKEKLDKINTESAWSKLRDLRNLSVGHPIEKRAKRNIERCYIVRVSLEQKDFDLIIWNAKKKNFRFEKIKLGQILTSYEHEAEEIMKKVRDALENLIECLEKNASTNSELRS